VLPVRYNAILRNVRVHAQCASYRKKSVGCQTDCERSGHDDFNSREDSLITLDGCDGDGVGKNVASTVATASTTDCASKQSDSSLKTTSYEKHDDSNCRVIVPRLTDAAIRTLISPLDRLPKISCKTVMEQQSRASGKRSASPDHEQQRTKQVKAFRSREMFLTLARTIESLADSGTDLGSMTGHEDVHSWCVNEALRAMEKYKHRPSERSLDSQKQ
jgi:hypothetical protein